MPRSGTTLLRFILDSHPNIACGPELRVTPAIASLSSDARRLLGDTLRQHYGLSEPQADDIYASLLLSFMRPYHEARGKPRFAEKTPANSLHFVELARLFPESWFIQIIRDGRDVVASLMEMDWTEGRTGERMAITRDPAAAARAWTEHIEAGRRISGGNHRYFEIRYEKILDDPAGALKPLFDFLEEPWREEVLDFHHNERIDAGMNETSAPGIKRGLDPSARGRWRKELNDAAKAAVKAVAGDTLIELGYASDAAW